MNPKLRFKDFKDDWIELKVSDAFEAILGGGTPKKNQKYWSGTIPWISSSDVPEGSISGISISRFITDEAISNSATKRIPKESVLIVSRVGVGKVAIAPTDLCTSQDFTNLIGCKGDPYFYAYNLSALMKRKSLSVQGSVIKGIPAAEIKEYKVKSPSPKEQTKIVELFTLIDKKISLTENKLTQLQSAKESLLFKIFSTQCSTFKLRPSESKKLTTIVEVSGGHTPSMADKSLWEPGKNIWLTSKDVKSEYLSDSEMKISDKGLKNLQQYPANSMVLVARSGILKHSLPLALVRTPFTVNQDLKVLQVKEDNPEFIFFALKAKTRKILQNFVKSGTTVQSLMMPELMQMELEIPDKATQDRIANFFILFDKKIEAQQKKITSLNRLKQSLMQQMFA